MKKVLLVGNCNYDSMRINNYISKTFNIKTDIRKTIDEAISELKKTNFDLVIVNRICAFDKRNGLELIDYMKENNSLTKVMLITNYEDKMQEAINHGAVKGFGKNDIDNDKAKEALKVYLE